MQPYPLTTRPYLRLLPLALALQFAACSDPVAHDGGDAPRLNDAPVAQLPPALAATYREDAVRLAIRHLTETNSPARHDVEPPVALVNSLLAALAQVYATPHPARDSVVGIYPIRTFPRPATWEVTVNISPAHGWTAAWRAGNARTGNSRVDALVDAYGLSVRQVYNWPVTGIFVVLRADRPLHAAALAARFDRIPGVIWAEQNGFTGDGNDIRASRHGDGWRLDYSVGFGDCPAGCGGRHTWSFSVSATGGVRYLGSSGPTM
jgi:hypothetical protein